MKIYFGRIWCCIGLLFCPYLSANVWRSTGEGGKRVVQRLEIYKPGQKKFSLDRDIALVVWETGKNTKAVSSLIRCKINRRKPTAARLCTAPCWLQIFNLAHLQPLGSKTIITEKAV